MVQFLQDLFRNVNRFSIQLFHVTCSSDVHYLVERPRTTVSVTREHMCNLTTSNPETRKRSEKDINVISKGTQGSEAVDFHREATEELQRNGCECKFEQKKVDTIGLRRLLPSSNLSKNSSKNIS